MDGETPELEFRGVYVSNGAYAWLSTCGRKALVKGCYIGMEDNTFLIRELTDAEFYEMSKFPSDPPKGGQ